MWSESSVTLYIAENCKCIFEKENNYMGITREFIQHFNSPLGPITIASNGDALTGLWFDGQKYDRATLGAEYTEKTCDVLEQTKQWLEEYFAGKKPKKFPPIQFVGTPFRQQVWNLLLEIPHGKTVTYGEISDMLKQIDPTSKACSRAIGGAVGHNPISIIVPCHRVMGADGKMTGYAGGVDKKIKLLELEKSGEI